MTNVVINNVNDIGERQMQCVAAKYFVALLIREMVGTTTEGEEDHEIMMEGAYEDTPLIFDQSRGGPHMIVWR